MSVTNAALDPQAAFFDERAKTWEERCYPPEARARLEQLTPLFGVKRKSTVLDLGTGTGILAPYLRKSIGPQGILVSLDISFEMLCHAIVKEEYAHGGLVVQATAMNLPIRSDSIDTVVCFAAFPHFSDKLLALREMHRVLRSGGNLCIAHLLSREELSRHHGKHEAVAEDRLPDDENMRSLFAEAGFSIPEIIDIPGRYIASAVKE